jgi:Ser/Thr protein kinase RdoA (MazF antagonist)
VRGRMLDELNDENLRHIGRLIGRMHAVGASREAPHRLRFNLEERVQAPLAVLEKGGFLPAALAPRYRDVALKIAEKTAEPLARVRAQRIHGDLHIGNLLWGTDGPILVDFDDFVVGPPLQDLWLLARGDAAEMKHALAQILEGYELFREFDRSTLALVEPLRALRILHMSAWIARRWEDPSFQAGFPAFRTDRYWMSEYEELYRIYEALG